jgi:hypothetical protein
MMGNPRRARLLASLVLVLSAAAWALPTTRPAVAATRPSGGGGGGGGITLFCPCWGNPPRSDAAWDAAARNHAVIAGQAQDIAPRAAHLHSVNPNVKLVVYNPGPYLNKNWDIYRTTLHDHPEYFAKDKNGRLINVPEFPNLYLMDQGVAGWRALHAQLAVQLAQGGIDGVYIDSLGSAPTSGPGYTSDRPVKPGSKQAYSAREWVDLSRQVINQIKAAVGTKYVMINGLSDGGRYKSEGYLLAQSNADGGMSESFVRHAKDKSSAYPSESVWKMELDEITDMARQGKTFFAWTKVWTNATDKERQAWETFSLATYLLGKDAKTMFNFLPADDVDRTTVFYPNQQAPIGQPKGAYTVSGGVYTREFTNGRVTVNPGAHTASITVN